MTVLKIIAAFTIAAIILWVIFGKTETVELDEHETFIS